MSNIDVLRKEVQKIFGRLGDIQVKENGKFLLACINRGMRKGFTGDPRTVGEPVNRYEVRYYVKDTLRNTATSVEFESTIFVEEEGKYETDCVVYNYDKNGKSHLAERITISTDSFIDPSKKTDLTKLLKVISEKNPQISLVIQDILDKFDDNKQDKLRKWRQGIENVFKLNASSILERRERRESKSLNR